MVSLEDGRKLSAPILAAVDGRNSPTREAAGIPIARWKYDHSAIVSTLRHERWVAGCERCRAHLLALCAAEGFEPEVGYTSDDMVVMQALVTAGLGVTTSPGLALRAHRSKGIVANELAGSHQRIYAATYGEPPDPPATAALLAALAEAAASIGGVMSHQEGA